MTSNRLLFNFKLFKEEYKKYIWAVALSCLGFLFSKLIVPLLSLSNYLNRKAENLLSQEYLKDELLLSLNNFLTLDYILNRIVVIILAIIVGSAIFSYLHNRKKVDFYHSLPISRNNLFFIKYILGIVIVVPIIIISHFILYAIFGFILKSDLVSFKEILKPVILDIVFFISIYSFIIFSHIIAGNTIIGLVVCAFIINLPLIILFICTLLTETFLNSVDIYDLLNSQLKYNPIICYFLIFSKDSYDYIYSHITDGLAYIFTIHSIITIIIIIISAILFKIRKSEKSNTCLAFKYTKPIFKYLGVCLGSILLGLIFHAIVNNLLALYLGIIIGCIILHCIVEIIYDFDFKAIFKNWYSIIGCIIISCVIVCIYQFDLFKRIEYVPPIEKIESIKIKSYDYITNSEISNITDKEIIQIVGELHKDYIGYVKEKNINSDYSFSMKISYNLKNNKTIKRYIYIANSDIELLDKLFNNKEFIKLSMPFLYDDNFDYTKKVYGDIPYVKMQIRDNLDNTYEINSQDLKELAENIKKDIEVNGISNYYYGNVLFEYYIEISKGSSHWDYDKYKIFITDKYTNTLEFLSKKGIIAENIKIEDIDSLYTNGFEIRDKEDIQKVLQDYTNFKNLFNYRYQITINFLTDDRKKYIYVPEDIYKELENKYKK